MNRVLISQRMAKDKYGQYYDYLESSYIKFFNNFDMIPILLPNSVKDVTNFYKKNRCNKIILTGGDDIFELASNKNKNDQIFRRDRNEKKLIIFAKNNKIPMFCICRGFQLTNLVLGGKLTKNILNKNIRAHEVIINKNYMTNINHKIMVNSFHNHGIKVNQLADRLVALGYSRDLKYIEFYEHEYLPIIGIQWHPERHNKSIKFNKIIFKKFLSNK